MAGPAYVSWAAQVGQLGGQVTTWPFQTPVGWFGQPAGKWPQATYASLFRSGMLDQSSAQSTDDGTFVYVVASDDVAAAAKVGGSGKVLAVVGALALGAMLFIGGKGD